MMDDEANDLDGLFEEYENGNEENEDNNNGVTNQSKPTENAEKVAAPRRAVKNPRLKFNADRLCGERGIPVVVKHFEGVKFKGKGHEVEDLNKLLSTLEHWCHRLYPSMKFDDCLRQIEKLGKKRPVQTCLRKIRFDMPILNDDFVHEEPEENEVEVPPQDAFDRLINEIQGSSDAQLASTPLPVKTAAPEYRLGSFGSTLTEEQRKRMEYNKMLATERRKAKFLATQSSTVPRNETEDLFAVESTSAIHSSSTDKIANSMFDDIFTESRSLLSTKSDKLHSASNDSSEEIELDDLVDLVNDDDDEPSAIRNEDNSLNTFPKMNKQGNVKKKFIILSDESDGDEIDKNYTEVVDLEDEVEKSSIPNKKIEVINLESKSNTEPIIVVNLDPETSLNVSNPAQKVTEVINLESHNTEPTTVVNLNPETSVNVSNPAHKITEVINLESHNTESMTVVNLDPETSVNVSNPLHVINLESEEVDLTNKKTVDDTNSEMDLASTPTISSTGVNEENFNLLSPEKDKISDSFNAQEIVQDNVESMEID